MKKINRIWSLALMLMLIATGCSKNESMSDMLNNVPDNTEIVVVANPASVLESFGCKIKDNKVEDADAMLQSFSTKSMSKRDLDKFETLLEVEGVNLESAILAANVSDGTVVGILNVTDKERFISWVEELDNSFTRTKYDGEPAVSLDETSHIIFDGNLAFIARGETARETARTIDNLRSKAKNKPMAAWKKAYFAENPTLGVIMPFEVFKDGIIRSTPTHERAGLFAVLKTMDFDGLESSFICAKGSLAGHKANLSYELMDKDGKDLKVPYLEGVGINEDLLKYAGKQDFALGIIGLPENFDWNAMLAPMSKGMSQDELMAMKTAVEVMSTFTGSIMVSAGIEPNAMSLDNPSSYHVVLAADVDENKAQQYIDMVTQYLSDDDVKVSRIDDATIKITKANTVFDEDTWEVSTDFNNPEIEVYIQNSKGQLVVSNQPISPRGGCELELGNLKGLNTVLVAKIDKSNVLAKMAGLKIDAKLKMTMTDSKFEGTLEVVGSDEDMPLLQTILTNLKKVL